MRVISLRALPTLRALTDKLGLPAHVSAAAALASVDKRYFRQVCDELDLPSYQWVDDVDQVGSLRFPVMVKPVDALAQAFAKAGADLISFHAGDGHGG